ncbi:hypothetical protein NX059_002145 [Plenodomus lindquistii]|nr:hypothetical protein NX059_002145 [Plenodomus lindquistii]
MPPKRRKATEPVDAPEAKRRVTRSSTKQQQSTSRPSPAEPRKASSPKTKSAINNKTKKKTAENPHPPPQTYTPLTIPSDLIKNPIQCHHYTRPPTTSTTPSPPLIFTHGAGGTLSASAILTFCTGFSRTTPILAFQGTMNLISRTKAFHACIAYLPSLAPPHPQTPLQSKKPKTPEEEQGLLLLGGRSMGARAAVTCASEHLTLHPRTTVKLVLISYPLVGPKDTRDQALMELQEELEVLFVVGDRDAMCPIDLLNETRGKMKARSQLVVVRGADHGMRVKPARQEKAVGEETGRVAARWVRGELEGGVIYVGGEEDEDGED